MIACRVWWAAWRLAALLAMGVLPGVVAAAPEDAGRAIAVVYPEIGEPYRSVFSTIIEGIEGQAGQPVPAFAVRGNGSGNGSGSGSGNAAELAAELRRREVRAVIVLGRNGLKVAAGLERQVGIIAGGVLSVPEAEAQGISVMSLAPDPALLFARLRGLMPAARRVIVVYDPRHNAWLIRLAREAAKAQGLELTALEADDLKGAVRLYQEALSTADPRRDVLWLPQDSTTVEDSAVLPLVLRESWNQNLAVFSSSVAHVKRGALFALYPDNAELGRTLASWAQAYISTGTYGARGILPLKDVLMAVNTRTASHLGISLRNSQQRFHMAFPEP